MQFENYAEPLAALSYWQQRESFNFAVAKQVRSVAGSIYPDDLTKVDKIVVKSFMFTCSKMFHTSASSFVGFRQYILKLLPREK